MLAVRTISSAVHAPADPARERDVAIVVGVGFAMLVGAALRKDPRLRWPARVLYTAIGCIIAYGVLATLTKEWG